MPRRGVPCCQCARAEARWRPLQRGSAALFAGGDRLVRFALEGAVVRQVAVVTREVEAVPDHEQVLDLEDAEVRVELDRSAEFVTVRITNDGETLDPAVVRRAFDRFYRSDPARDVFQ